jgi:UDP-glucose 4-epimerase
MNILVTGGAGYIGSILCEALLKEYNKVVILDNLRQGHRHAVPEGAELVSIDICNKERLDTIFKGCKVDTVMHLAAETVVENSITDPKQHFGCNIVGGINLLDVMLEHNVKKIVFSSSAAVYGSPENVPIEETDPKKPINAYGDSKLMFENILRWYAKAYGINYVILRYFNASGASIHFGEDHNPETHLIPNILNAVLGINNSLVPIYGLDHPTKDGTCIRDYLHVIDIAKAHVLALQKIDYLNSRIYNLGNEAGYSVLDIINAARQITGVNIVTKAAPRRIGDPPVLIANSKLAREELNWKPQHSGLEEIINSAWQWKTKHPNGYKKF